MSLLQEMSVYGLADCEFNREFKGFNLLPLCPDCKTVLVMDSQTKQDYYAWCADCGHDYYECEITDYKVRT